MPSRDQKRKDLVLTTLIDLLVQIVFILAFFIVINNVISSTTEPSYQELWRHLVESIFDRRGSGDPKQQTNEAVAEVKKLRAENARLKYELDKCIAQNASCTKDLSACVKRCPFVSSGPPVCEMSKPLLNVTVTQTGQIRAVATLEGSSELAKIRLSDLPLQQELTSLEFEQSFGRIKVVQKDCRYRINVGCEDRNLPTWQYEAGLQSINLLFNTPRQQRSCR